MIKRLGASKIWAFPVLLLFLIFLISETFPQIPEQSQSDAAKRIEAGKKLSNEGEHKEAIIQLLEGLTMAKTKEETSEACLYLALCYYALGERANCARCLKNLFEAQPEREIEALYFPAAFVGLFYQAKNEAAKQAALKPEAKAGTKAEEKKAAPEKKTESEKKAEVKTDEKKIEMEKKAEPIKKEEIKAEPEKKKEGEKSPSGLGKGAQAAPAKKKGKFPWLIAGGAVVGGGILAVVLLNKKEPSGPTGPQVGNIAITSTPTGAKVYLDGTDTDQRTDCTLTNISAGNHALKLELENYGKWQGSVAVIADQTANVTAALAGFTYEFVTKWGSQGSGDGQFNEPHLLAVDSSDNIYVADENNHRIQKFGSSGAFLNSWGSQGNGNGQFNQPVGVAIGGVISGNVYVTENHRVQKLNSAGTFLTQWGGYPEWLGTWGVAADNSGYIYVVISGYQRIEKYTSDGTFVAMWGGVQGSGDGEFKYPYGIAVDASGNVYVTECENHRIQKFSPSGAFVTKWGSQGSQDGQFRTPDGIAVDKSGFVYVADQNNNRVQKFTSNGTFMTKWGISGSGDGQFIWPRGVAVDNSGYVYVSDALNHRIQKFRMTSETQQAARITYAPLRIDPLVPRLPELRPWPSLLSLPRMKILPQELPRAANSPEGEKQKRK